MPFRRLCDKRTFQQKNRRWKWNGEIQKYLQKKKRLTLIISNRFFCFSRHNCCWKRMHRTNDKRISNREEKKIKSIKRNSSDAQMELYADLLATAFTKILDTKLYAREKKYWKKIAVTLEWVTPVNETQ